MSQQTARWSFHNTSLERSFVWSLAVTSLPAISGFLVSWVVARWGGPSVIGTVSWAMSFATAVLILAKFGLDLGTSRLASEYGVNRPGRLRSLFVTGLSLRIVFTLPVAALSFLFARPLAEFFKDPSLVNAIRVASAVVVCASIYEFKEGFLVGLNRIQTVYGIRSVQLGLRVLFVGWLVLFGFGATEIIGGYCAAWLVAIAVYAMLIKRHLPESDGGENDGQMTRRLFMLSATLAISSASVTIYSHMDRLMLGYFVGMEEVGQYAVARNITEVSLFPAFAMVMVLRPALAARYSSADLSQCKRIIRNSLRFSLMSGVLFAAIFAVLGAHLVTVVFSENFRYSGELLVIFVGVIVFRSVGSVILPALIAAERTRTYAWLTAASAALNFGLNLVLIPRYGARGAIAATIISYGFLLWMGLREVFVTYGVRVRMENLALSARTILAGVLSGTIIWWLTRQFPMKWDAFLWAALLSLLYVFWIRVLRVGSLGDLSGLLTNLRGARR